LFYFSGHGIPREDEIYLATPQVDPLDPIVEGFSLSNLAKLMKSCKSKRIVSIIDACHSGAAKLPGSDMTPKARAMIEVEEAGIALANYDKMLDNTPKGEGRYFLLSSQAYQSSFALANDNSIYTKYLIEGLLGARPTRDDSGTEIPGSVRKDGAITPESLHEYVYFQVASRMDQIPKLKVDKSSTVVLAHYPKLASELDGARTDYENLISKGQELAYKGKYEDAITQYDKAIVINPNNSSAWKFKGSALRSLIKHAEALASLDKATELDPNDSSTWFSKYWNLCDLRRSKEALACLDKAIELDPDEANYLYQKASNLENQGQHEEALAWYDKAMEAGQNNSYAPYAGLRKAALLKQLGRDEEANACYDKILEMHPNNALVWADKARFLETKERYQDALACYDTVTKIDPTNALTWKSKAHMLQRTGGNSEEIIACYDKATELDPNHANNWLDKGIFLKSIGETEKAEECFKKARELR
jgi:tetratricopeptide (TPR) repeat protein